MKIEQAARDAARKERQRATARMPKCGCGNVAGLGQTQCSRCRAEDAEREQEARRKAWIDEQMEQHTGQAIRRGDDERE